jgi:hypothetical protein
MRDTLTSERKEAVQDAKLAVRAYARDPSPENEAGVEAAFGRVRRLNGVARWRRAPSADCLRRAASK